MAVLASCPPSLGPDPLLKSTYYSVGMTGYQYFWNSTFAGDRNFVAPHSLTQCNALCAAPDVRICPSSGGPSGEYGPSPYISKRCVLSGTWTRTGVPTVKITPTSFLFSVGPACYCNGYLNFNPTRATPIGTNNKMCIYNLCPDELATSQISDPEFNSGTGPWIERNYNPSYLSNPPILSWTGDKLRLQQGQEDLTPGGLRNPMIYTTVSVTAGVAYKYAFETNSGFSPTMRIGSTIGNSDYVSDKPYPHKGSFVSPITGTMYISIIMWTQSLVSSMTLDNAIFIEKCVQP